MEAQKVLRELESALTKQKRIVEELRSDMIAEMDEVGTESYKGSLGSLAVIKSQVPVVKDWEAFYQYVDDHKAFDLLQRRVSSTAWRDRVESGEQIAGTETFNKQTLRITLAKEGK